MSKICDWEIDDAMYDYYRYQAILDELIQEEEPDEEEIARLQDIINDYEEALFK